MKGEEPKQPEQKRAKKSVEFFPGPTEDEKRKDIQALMDNKQYFLVLRGYASLNPFTLTSDDWRRKMECHQHIGASYGIVQLAMEAYLEAISCYAKISAHEMTSVDRENMAKIFSCLIKAVDEFSHTWNVNHQNMQKFLEVYLNNFELLNSDRSKFLGLEGIELSRMKHRVNNGWLEPSLCTTTRLLMAIIAMFWKDPEQANPKLREEIDSLRALAVDNKDPALEKTFDLFVRALILTKVDVRPCRVTFREPEPPKRALKK